MGVLGVGGVKRGGGDGKRDRWNAFASTRIPAGGAWSFKAVTAAWLSEVSVTWATSRAQSTAELFRNSETSGFASMKLLRTFWHVYDVSELLTNPVCCVL